MKKYWSVDKELTKETVYINKTTKRKKKLRLASISPFCSPLRIPFPFLASVKRCIPFAHHHRPTRKQDRRRSEGKNHPAARRQAARQAGKEGNTNHHTIIKKRSKQEAQETSLAVGRVDFDDDDGNVRKKKKIRN